MIACSVWIMDTGKEIPILVPIGRSKVNVTPGIFADVGSCMECCRSGKKFPLECVDVDAFALCPKRSRMQVHKTAINPCTNLSHRPPSPFPQRPLI